MICHISVYFLQDPNPENLQAVAAALQKAGEGLECVSYRSGLSAFPVPAGAPAGPMFGDAAQVILFEREEQAARWPMHPNHRALFAATDDMVDKVTVIDFHC